MCKKVDAKSSLVSCVPLLLLYLLNTIIMDMYGMEYLSNDMKLLTENRVGS